MAKSIAEFFDIAFFVSVFAIATFVLLKEQLETMDTGSKYESFAVFTSTRLV